MSPAMAGLAGPTRLESASFTITLPRSVVKSEGAGGLMVRTRASLGAVPLCTATGWDPAAISNGTWALIWVGDTYKSGALRSPISTTALFKLNGADDPCQPRRLPGSFARFEPNIGSIRRVQPWCLSSPSSRLGRVRSSLAGRVHLMRFWRICRRRYAAEAMSGAGCPSLRRPLE